MKPLYPIVFVLLLCAQISQSQTATYNCDNLTATFSAAESRCASTGSITINATGGSGNYGYKIVQPFTTPLTSTSTITGLPPGTYSVYTKDMISGCTFIKDNIVVGGNYSDPRFQLLKNDLTCINSTDGQIDIANVTNGRLPFTYEIISPSPAAVGTVSALGSFAGLPAGYYFIQLKDSCGGIQTRSVAVDDYAWTINSHPVTKLDCNTVSTVIELLDNKGNSNLLSASFLGFQYGAVNSPGDTAWTILPTVFHAAFPLRTVTFVVKDRCGSVKSFNWTNAIPSLGSNFALSGYTCNTFNANVTGATNVTSPTYCLKQGATTVMCNSSGNFTNIDYGSYCVEMTDACYDTVITRCFTVNPPVPSAGVVKASDEQCSTFTATVAGLTNLFNAQFCIYTSTNVQVDCNTTGVFPNLAYGDYCIRIVSAAPCYDTTIERCFSATAPIPVVPNVVISNAGCSGFDASLSGTNLFNPSYCLYDNNGVLIYCNTTGVFPGLAYGQYCINVNSAAPCYDTTIVRCFSVGAPVPTAANPVISNKACATFTVTIPSVTNIDSPEYTLHDENDIIIATNTTGVFDNVAYGSYCIWINSTSTTTQCAVTPVSKCFAVAKPIRSVAAAVLVKNKTCDDFTADVDGETNFQTPSYSIFDSGNVLVSTNTTGVFNNLTYGSYVIRITDACLDTTIERTVTAAKDLISFTVAATESCTIGTTNINVVLGGGQGPFQIDVINPIGNVIASSTIASGSYNFIDLPALAPGWDYKIAVASACGTSDTIIVSPKASVFSHTRTVTSKCPSANWSNGSGDLVADLVSNMGMYAPVIISKDGVATAINPSLTDNISTYHRRYTFADMAPGTYVMRYTISTCSKSVYDTIVVSPYIFPDLQNSAAYQCDNNNFSVNAVAAHGVSPFTYEIIGSNPTGPSIVSGAQASPIFNINTASPYSLVRMRAIDACGNGTLNDVSVLPLGNLSITSSNIDCYSNFIRLSVDTIPNATYTWYKKTSPTDSTLINTSQNYEIPYLLPSDTGMYVCKTVVNGGCLIRLSYYAIQGDCDIILASKLLLFEGKLENNRVPLKWKVADEKNVRSYAIERKAAGSSFFEEIGSVNAINGGITNAYNYTDMNPGTGVTQYRLRIVNQDGKFGYSNVINVQNEADLITAGPNPVKDVLNIQIGNTHTANYSITLYNGAGQVVSHQLTGELRNGSFKIQRTRQMAPGMYVLKIENKSSGYVFTKKMLFE